MMGFTVLSSMFMGNVMLFIVLMGQGDMLAALFPLIGSAATGSGVTRILMVPVTVKDPS